MFEMNYAEGLLRAEAGDHDAMFNWASHAVWSDQQHALEPETASRAVSFYRTLIDEDSDWDSMLDLGAMYLAGRGVSRDTDKAMAYFQMAADDGCARAWRCIGNYYRYDRLEDGYPLPTAEPARLTKALEAYRNGAEEGEQNCLYELGDMYRTGLLVDVDRDLAFALYSKAWDVIDGDEDDDSYADVALRLGMCYHYGWGTGVDLQKALELATIARDRCVRWVKQGFVQEGSGLREAQMELMLLNMVI